MIYIYIYAPQAHNTCFTRKEMAPPPFKTRVDLTRIPVVVCNNNCYNVVGVRARVYRVHIRLFISTTPLLYFTTGRNSSTHKKGEHDSGRISSSPYVLLFSYRLLQMTDEHYCAAAFVRSIFRALIKLNKLHAEPPISASQHVFEKEKKNIFIRPEYYCFINAFRNVVVRLTVGLPPHYYTDDVNESNPSWSLTGQLICYFFLSSNKQVRIAHVSS